MDPKDQLIFDLVRRLDALEFAVRSMPNDRVMAENIRRMLAAEQQAREDVVSPVSRMLDEVDDPGRPWDFRFNQAGVAVGTIAAGYIIKDGDHTAVAAATLDAFDSAVATTYYVYIDIETATPSTHSYGYVDASAEDWPTPEDGHAIFRIATVTWALTDDDPPTGFIKNWIQHQQGPIDLGHDRLHAMDSSDDHSGADYTGKIPYSDATASHNWQLLPANSEATNKFLRSVNGGIPSWAVIDAADITGLHARLHLMDSADDHDGPAYTGMIPYSDASDDHAWTLLAANASATVRQYLMSTNSAIPAWTRIIYTDLSDTVARGDLLTTGAAVGGTNPWKLLSANGADSALFLKSRSTINGGEPAWASVAWADVTGKPDIPTAYLKPFDLTITGTTQIRIVTRLANSLVICAGVRKTVSNGTTMSFDTDYGSLPSETYVFVKVAITSSAGATVYTCTLEKDTVLPDGGDTGAGTAEFYIPLWYIPASGGTITTASIIDLRGFALIPALGN